MKRLLILTLLAVFALGAGVANAATTLKTSGELAFGFQWLDNPDFFKMDDDNTSEDDFQAYQRARVYFDWSASESLRAVIGLEIGQSNWGVSGGGADLDADDMVVEVKHAYLDFKWPNTALSFRMGVQPIALPGAVAGSPILDGDAAGVLASYPINDMISAAFGWFRLQDSDAAADTGGRRNDGVNDEIDLLALLLPMKGEGWTLTPWAAYAIVGKNSTNDANGVVALAYNGMVNSNNGTLSDNLDVWWVGRAFTLDMFAPFSVKGDLIYGWSDGANGTGTDGGVGERSGWFFDLAVDYKMDMVTPGLFFMYSTGEDDDLSDSERIPTMYGCYYLTSLGMANAASVLDGVADGVLTNDGTMGIWVIGGQLANFSFVDKLSHTLRIAYGQGTTDEEYVKKGYANQNANYTNYNTGLYVMTEKDSFWEVNFDSTYSIYENLTAYVELGYLHLDLDDVWKSHSHGLGVQDTSQIEDVWKLAFCLKYAF